MIAFLAEFFKTYWLAALLSTVAAFLLGSINSAIIISNAINRKDIRNYGSGNAGATNMTRKYGVVAGLVTFACDVLKGVLAVALSRLLVGFIVAPEFYSGAMANLCAYIAGLACILGHVYPVFFGLKGGKGVSTSLGVLLLLDWRIALICLAVFALVFAISRMVSLGSIISVCCAPPAAFCLERFLEHTDIFNTLCITVFALAMAVIIISRHYENIKRIVKGTEPRFSISNVRGKPEDGDKK